MSSRALKTYAAWVVRHRFAVLFAVLLGTLFLARATTRLHVEVDPDRQLPQDHPFIQTLNDVHRIFGDKNLVVIGLFPHDGNVFTPAFLKKLAEVTDAVRRLPGATPALVQSLALLVIGLVHYEAFRTLQALFLPLLTALLSVLWAVGLMGLLGVPLDPFNTTTPILILAVAAGHAVQVLKRFYEEFDRTHDVEAAIAESLARVGPVMIAAGTIAALSFCSLVTFRTATIRTFGLFTGFGILSALVIELTIIPAVRAMLPTPRRREREREAAAHPWLDAFLRASARAASGRGKRRVFAGAALLIAACAVFASRIQIDMSTKPEFSAREPVRQDDAAINAHFAGTNTLIALVEGTGEGSLEEPAIMRAIYRLERNLEAEPGVGKAVSYVDFVRKMHLAMNADRSDAGELPGTRALTAQYLFLYTLSGGADDFDTLLDPTHRTAKVRLLVHEDSTRYGERLIALAQEQVARTFPPGYRVRYSGSLASPAAATEVMVHGKLRNIVQITLITLAIASLLLRSVVGGLLVAMPLGLTVAVNFGVMGLLGIPLDTITSAISAMAVGIGADSAIYFLFRVREELAHGGRLEDALGRALMTSGKAVLFVSSAIAFGYATLCLSGFGLHVQLGSLVALAMLVSSGSALVLLPAVVARFRPAFLWGGFIIEGRERATQGAAVPAWSVTRSARGAGARHRAPGR